jgi:hypothetical protein
MEHQNIIKKAEEIALDILDSDIKNIIDKYTTN